MPEEVPSRKSAKPSPPAPRGSSRVKFLGRPSGERQLRVDDAGLHEEDLRAELDGVVTLRPGVIHRHLPRLRLDQVGRPVGVAELLITADFENGHAAQILVEPRQSDQFVDVPFDVVVDFGVGIEIVPAETDVGDQRRAPDAVPAEHRIVAGHVERVAAREERAVLGRRQSGSAAAELLLAAPAREQIVFVRQVVVPADIPFAEVLVAGRLKRVVPGQTVVLGIGVEVFGDRRDRIEPRRRDRLIGKGFPRIGNGALGGERIVDRVGKLGKVALPHERRRNRPHERRRLADVGQLHVAEQERLVPLDRTADGEAVLLAAELRLLAGGEVGLGVHRFIAHEEEARAVKVVGARLDGQRDDARRRLAVFGGKAVGDDLELGHRVHRRLDGFFLRALRGDGLVVVVHAVDHEVDFGAALAADRNALAAGDDGARRDHGKLQVVAAVERQVHDLTVFDHRAGRTLGGLQQRRGRLDFDDLGHRADLEGDVQLADVADGQGDARPGIRLESVRLDDNDVVADTQRIRAVVPGFVGLRGGYDARLDMVEGDVNARDDGARGV